MYGDPIIFREIRWRVAKAQKMDVPKGYVPIKPEDEEAEGITGIINITIDDALGYRA